jgi:hypothetical protein
MQRSIRNKYTILSSLKPRQSVGRSRAVPKRTYVHFAKVDSPSLQGKSTFANSLAWKSLLLEARVDANGHELEFREQVRDCTRRPLRLARERLFPLLGLPERFRVQGSEIR